MVDQGDVLTDILSYDPKDDPTTLLSRAYNEIERLRESKEALVTEVKRLQDRVTVLSPGWRP